MVQTSTSAVVGGDDWWSSWPGVFTPGEIPPVIHWIGGSVSPQSRFGHFGKRKLSCLCRLSACDSRSRSLQPSHYPDWAIPAYCKSVYWINILIFKVLVHAILQTRSVSIIKTCQLLVYTEMIAAVLRSVQIAVCRMKKFLMFHLMVRKISTGF